MIHRSAVGAILLAAACLAGISRVAPAPRAAGGDPYAEADRRALAAPAEVESSVEALAAYLTGPFAADDLKARAIFRWIADRVAYDTEAAAGEDPSAGGVASALKDRKAVCFGYAGLFQELARTAGLEVVVVEGFGKGYHYEVGTPVPEVPNHAWNAVKIGGAWRLLDCTWGAGRADEGFRFVKHLDDHYFLTPPETFIFDHLPADPRWQLLETPVTRQAFAEMPFLQSTFFALGLSLPADRRPVLDVAGGRAEISLACPASAVAAAKLLKDGKIPVEDGSLVRRDGERLTVLAALQGPGRYVLRLLAKAAADPGDLVWAADFLVTAPAGTGTAGPFPFVFKEYVDYGASLEEPLEGRLEARGRTRFRIRVPGASEVVVSSGKHWRELKASGGVFEERVPLEPGPVKVGARLPGETRYVVLLRYDAR